MQLSDLIHDVRPDIPGAPNFVMQDAVQKAANRFFVDSHAWVAQLDPVTIATGVIEYDLSLPNDTIMVRVYAEDERETGVRIGTDRMTVVHESNLFTRHRDPDGGYPQLCAITAENDSLLVWPTPSADYNGALITIMAVLAPTREAIELPDALLIRFRDAIVAKAKAALMLTNGKTWSNPQQGALETQTYYNAVACARRETMTARFAGSQTVRQRPFA